MRRNRVVVGLFAWVLGSGALAHAQPFGGFDVALHGGQSVQPGNEHLVRGRAFGVRGVGRLRVLPRAVVKARYVGMERDVANGPWVEGRADARGNFTLHVAIPPEARGRSQLELSVGNATQSRTIESPLTVESPFMIDLRTDRAFYEPGETVHLWALVRDRRTLAPVANRSLKLSIDLPGRDTEREVRTLASGVGHLAVELGANEAPGNYAVAATLDRRTRARESVSIGRRTQERLMAELEWDVTRLPPSAPFQPRVTVRAPSGAAVRDAVVTLTVEGADPITAQSNAEGVATFDTHAPAYLPSETGYVSVTAQVRHAAHGAASTSRRLRLAVPLTLQVHGIAAGGALVPEVKSRLFVQILDAAGDPPEPGTQVKVNGPGLRNEERRTDVHGLVAVDVRLQRGEAARHRGGDCNRAVAASFDVEIEGPRARHSRFCVPVWPEVRVRPVVESVVVEPGAALNVELRRRPDAARRAVSVSVYRGRTLLAAQVVTGNRVQFEAPRALGLLHIETRVVGDPARASSAESIAGVDVVLVRPASPAFLEATPRQPVYSIGETATVDVTSAAGLAGWFAVDVRDLAQHGGERPFAMLFLRGQVRKALLNPDTPELDRLARASLATISAPAAPNESGPLVDDFGRNANASYAGAAPGARDLRDPVAAGQERMRRGIQPLMRVIEQALANAEDPSRLYVGEGARRRFHEDLVERVAPDSDVRTQGELPVSIAALRDADPSFSYQTVARRVTRARLVRALVALASYLSDTSPANDELPSRWVSRLVQRGLLQPADLKDPWGGTLGVRTRPAGGLSVAPNAPDRALAFPGPDGRLNTRDDIVDPFARVVPTQTPYALAIGEDELMDAFSVIAPGRSALQAMIAAHERMTRAQQEAQTGDAATADATQGMLMGDQVGESFGFGGLGMIGTSGGGGGSGYGRGAGGLRGRRARAPRIRAGHASVSGSGSLQGLVREEFPGTLRFVPSMEADPSGSTAVQIPLAHAATTYLVEVVHWRPDGWSWTTQTEVRVDQDLVVDAPVPRFVTEGDLIKLPLRASNRSRAAMDVRLSLYAEGELEVDDHTTEPRAVAAGDAAVVEVELRPRSGQGHLRVEGRSERVDDATRRPLQVLPNARRALQRVSAFLGEDDELELQVPANARRRRGGSVVITTGRALFGGDVRWTAWARALRDELTREDRRSASNYLAHTRDDEGDVTGDPVQLALTLGILWDARAMSTADGEATFVTLTESLVQSDPNERQTEIAALGLLALAPALQRPRARPALANTLNQLRASLRATIEAGATAHSDAPAIHAAAAAATAWSGSERARSDRARAAEHIRRAARSVVRFADDVWLQARSPSLSSQNLAPTALLALAYAGTDQRDEAFELVRTLGVRAMAARAPVPRWRSFSPAERGLGSAAAQVLMGPALQSVRVVVNGEAQLLTLVDGVGRLDLPELDRPGRHVVAIRGADDRPIHVRMRAEYAMPWTATRRGAGPMRVTVTASDPALRVDHTDTYVIRVHNPRPRTLRHAIVEIDLPTGTELDETAFQHLENRLVRRPVHEQKTLRLELMSLLPGRHIEIPLRLRWTLAGRLQGLGVHGYAAGDPTDGVVIAPRILEVESAR